MQETKGTPISREELLAFVSVEQLVTDPRIIDVFISRIREKLNHAVINQSI
ncbi:winged helix-turn-helix domain-containing protein [Anaerobacillus sp. HL2]|nr:winged helix-turn-helix domain-containing protein [Anaerobacillus sp. HL2]